METMSHDPLVDTDKNIDFTQNIALFLDDLYENQVLTRKDLASFTDTQLYNLLTRVYVPENYSQMIPSERINMYKPYTREKIKEVMRSTPLPPEVFQENVRSKNKLIQTARSFIVPLNQELKRNRHHTVSGILLYGSRMNPDRLLRQTSLPMMNGESIDPSDVDMLLVCNASTPKVYVPMDILENVWDTNGEQGVPVSATHTKAVSGNFFNDTLERNSLWEGRLPEWALFNNNVVYVGGINYHTDAGIKRITEQEIQAKANAYLTSSTVQRERKAAMDKIISRYTK